MIAWWTRRQRSVSASTAEAEYFAASLAAREGVFIRDLLDDLGFGVTSPTPLLLDSKAAINLAEDPVAFKKTKHILRAANELRDRVARCVYAPEHVASADQLADVLTKPLRPGAHAAALDSLLGLPAVVPAATSSSSATPIDSSPEGVLVSSQEGVFRGDP